MYHCHHRQHQCDVLYIHNAIPNFIELTTLEQLCQRVTNHVASRTVNNLNLLVCQSICNEEVLSSNLPVDDAPVGDAQVCTGTMHVKTVKSQSKTGHVPSDESRKLDSI